jgi:hypothetical protein
MQERFNWHAWKACVPQKGTGGSNPPLSAKPKQTIRQLADGFLFSGFPFKACFDKGTMKTKITRIAGFLWLCWFHPGIANRRKAVSNHRNYATPPGLLKLFMIRQ